jgi:hypothetical protein
MCKDDCMKDCQLLKAVQRMERTSHRNCSAVGIDCAEESRYRVTGSPGRIGLR